MSLGCSAPNCFHQATSVADKMERQAVRYRDRQRKRHRHVKQERLPEPVLPKELEDVEIRATIPRADEQEEAPLRVVKAKRFEMMPMTVDEAADRIELLNHDFYVFRNSDDSDSVTVIYRRRGGDLGLIAPVDAGS